MPFESTDPTTEESLASFEPLDETAIDAALGRAGEGFAAWRATSFEERSARLESLAELLERGKDAFALLMTREMGKPISGAVSEVEKCAWACRHYAEEGPALLEREELPGSGAASWVEYHPLGAILIVMPWNFPFWQVIRCAAPTLMAGNAILLKHAPNVPQCAIAIEGLFSRAGFPGGAFQNLFAEVEDIPRILEDDVVQGASLTGSVGAGASFASEAGRRIKTTVLELGGSDPYLVMESADLEGAVATAVQARTINNGQSCIAAKRFIVQEGVADDFTRGLVDGMAGLRVGDPGDPGTDVGPLARRDLRDTLARQVEDSIAAGARVATGGRAPDRTGWFYTPTVLTDVPDGCPAAEEELFGPVASVFRVRDIDEAIEVANGTRFGLSSAIWTRDPDERDRAIRDLEAGSVFVNGMSASDPRLPFGGVKASGYGRELGPHGIREFVNVKTVWLGDD